MGGNRRFRGMRHPASREYSRLPTMERHNGTKDEPVGRQSVMTMMAVLLLCVCVLAAGAVLLMKYSLTINSDNKIQDVQSPTEGYTSTSFVADASEVATELLTAKTPYRYSSTKFITHQAQTLTADELTEITRRADIDHLYSVELAPLLNVRVPGTPGIERAREHIISQLRSHGIWDIEEDDFDDRTPYGMKKFVNVVATLRPEIKRRLVIACHYDSKYFAPRKDGKVFIGATDSAVPCAMMLDLGRNLADLLSSTTQVSTSLQLIFFDGEEAFKHWTSTDSLYGSRHLARKMQDTPHPLPSSKTNQLDAMDMFILLDLIGTENPTFRNYYPATSAWFSRLVDIETRLKSLGEISARQTSYFDPRHSYAGIEDDHRPFVSRGVNRVIHLIAHPFPSVWHTVDDNADALHAPTIDDLNKILHVFAAEYLHLLDSQPATAD